MELKINDGITSSQIEELIKYSNSDLLIKETTNDLERFKNRLTFDKWLSKKRVIYTLSDNSNSLLGIIWFGAEVMPNNKNIVEKINPDNFVFTFAIRLYSVARGKGIATTFLTESMKKFKETNDFKNSQSKGFWLETLLKNERAIKTYSDFGFKKISEVDKSGKIIMILS